MVESFYRDITIFKLGWVGRVISFFATN